VVQVLGNPIDVQALHSVQFAALGLCEPAALKTCVQPALPQGSANVQSVTPLVICDFATIVTCVQPETAQITAVVQSPSSTPGVWLTLPCVVIRVQPVLAQSISVVQSPSSAPGIWLGCAASITSAQTKHCSAVMQLLSSAFGVCPFVSQMTVRLESWCAHKTGEQLCVNGVGQLLQFRQFAEFGT
jgi:hypothetical protein